MSNLSKETRKVFTCFHLQISAETHKALERENYTKSFWTLQGSWSWAEVILQSLEKEAQFLYFETSELIHACKQIILQVTTSCRNCCNFCTAWRILFTWLAMARKLNLKGTPLGLGCDIFVGVLLPLKNGRGAPGLLNSVKTSFSLNEEKRLRQFTKSPLIRNGLVALLTNFLQCP